MKNDAKVVGATSSEGFLAFKVKVAVFAVYAILILSVLSSVRAIVCRTCELCRNGSTYRRTFPTARPDPIDSIGGTGSKHLTRNSTRL